MPNAKIMIVEDERIVADDLKDNLVVMGYNVCGKAYSGEQALVMVEKELPDLVMMDIKLEGVMDGIETAGLIKERFNVPVIFLTAFSDEHILQRAKMTASFGYLLKPIQYSELRSTIEMALYKHRIDKELLQAKKLESVGILAGGIAHDFNNILAIIIGNTELALDDVPEWNPAHINLEEIKTASIRAKDIVSQLLNFCRKTAQERKPIQIIPIIKDSLKFLRATIPMSIDIRQDIQATDDAILADHSQINQVVINLCTNAGHAMPDGGILEVSLKNVDLDEDTSTQYHDLNSGRYLNLTVTDTGHGISQKKIDRIFDPYFTTKVVGKDTGMGLAVVHGIVKEHNGIITVESDIEKGTTFSIFFPIIAKGVVVETKTDKEFPTGNEKILFIDDEKSIVKLWHQGLEQLGYKVESTTSPIEALERFSSQPDKFDLVITDMMMPQMTGDHLVEEIMKIRPDMPIILCTGFSEKIDEKKAKKIGICQYVEKPLNRSNLAKLVRKVLDEG